MQSIVVKALSSKRSLPTWPDWEGHLRRMVRGVLLFVQRERVPEAFCHPLFLSGYRAQEHARRFAQNASRHVSGF
jgi:hypothetical protein